MRFLFDVLVRIKKEKSAHLGTDIEKQESSHTASEMNRLFWG